MSPVEETETAFERQARGVLAESVLRIDARTRSRLNQARQAALEAARARARRPVWWRGLTLMPAAGAVAAALLVTVTLWQRERPAELPLVEHTTLSAEDMDLLADSDGLDLIEGWDGPFYEWAADQTEGNAESNG
jgi:hypothetical protein